MYACILNEEECYKNWKEELLNTWIEPKKNKLNIINSMKIRLRNIFIYIYISQSILFIMNYIII
jgi:hypothetical protein